jgi:hypothetical protein
MTAIMSCLNAVLSINRLGRGNAALFLLLSYGAIGAGISIVTRLVLAMTAALWYNGLNDLYDLEIDRAAYGNSAPRKVLVNGAMTPRALCAWLAVLTAASAALLIVDVRANLPCLLLFTAGILSSVVYNRYSKYLEHPAVLKFIVLDVIVAGPFFFYYAGLVAAPDARPDSAVVIATIGSLIGCGLYGNFIFASKDLTTDARSTRTLPMILGSTVGEHGAVQHSLASKAYMLLLVTLISAVLVYAAFQGHWFALVVAARFLMATVRLCSGTVTERGHRKLFVTLSNWEMALLLSLYIRDLTAPAAVQLVVLGVLIVLANVAYFHDQRAGRGVMLRFGKAMGA